MNPLGWLTADGAIAAALVGIAVGTGAGAWGLAMLFLFLISGSLFSAARSGRSERSGRSGRTAVQVLANGWAAVLGALLVPLHPHIGWPVLTGGLAAAQGDTWATEIGLQSSRRPVLLTTRRPVAPGTSGAVTGLGSVGGLAGTLVMAALAFGAVGPRLAAAAAAGGVVGSVADSLLGATIQSGWRCDTCDRYGEDRRPACGHVARLARGWPWVDNHVVNTLGSGAGAVTALAVHCLLS